MKRSYQTPLLLLLLVSFLAAGCNTPRRALNQGDYERAVRLSVDKLRSSPNNKKAAEVLERACRWPLICM